MDMDRKSRKIYFQMAVIGYKHTFKKLIELIKLKIKQMFLEIEYKVLKMSLQRELRKTIPKKRDWRKTILKYLCITIIGFGLFALAAMQLEKDRGYKTIGGEGILLLLPLIYFLGTALQGNRR